MATKKMGPVGGFIFGVIMVLAGGAVGLFFGWPMVKQARASEDWPVVQGTISVSEVTSKRDSDGDTQYTAKVRYSYEVDGQNFESDRVWFGGNFSTSRRGDAEKTISTYPVGQQVDVHYDPKNLNEAVLQPGAFKSTYMVLGFSALFFFLGLALLGSSLVKLIFAAGIISVFVAQFMRKKPTEQAAGSAIKEAGSGFSVDEANDGFAVDDVPADSGWAVSDEPEATKPEGIELDCPHCGHHLRIPRKFAGQIGKCKHCQESLTVPEN